MWNETSKSRSTHVKFHIDMSKVGIECLNPDSCAESQHCLFYFNSLILLLSTCFFLNFSHKVMFCTLATKLCFVL